MDAKNQGIWMISFHSAGFRSEEKAPANFKSLIFSLPFIITYIDTALVKRSRGCTDIICVGFPVSDFIAVTRMVLAGDLQ